MAASSNADELYVSLSDLLQRLARLERAVVLLGRHTAPTRTSSSDELQQVLDRIREPGRAANG